MKRITMFLAVFALMFLAAASEAQSNMSRDDGRWFVGAQLGRTVYERPFAPPPFLCFKPCLVPDVQRGTTATVLVGRRFGDLFAVHASVAPFIERSSTLYFCGGGSSGIPSCVATNEFRRWLEYKVAVEVHARGHVRPFLGGAMGLAGYRRFESEGRHNRGIWDVRAGVESKGKAGFRLEISRTQHLNPPWDEDDSGEPSFADWQVKAGIVFSSRAR